MTLAAAQAFFATYQNGSTVLLWPTLPLGIVDRWIVLAGDDAEGCWVFWNQLYLQENPRGTHIAHFLKLNTFIEGSLELHDDNKNQFLVEALTPEDQRVWDEYQKLKLSDPEYFAVTEQQQIDGYLSGDCYPPGVTDININPEFRKVFFGTAA